MIITQILTSATQELSSISDTPHLDAETLLTHILQQSRAYLIAHGERHLTQDEQNHFQLCLARRQQGEPIAYILGHKEFWSLDLQVTPATLVPRPETELLVELVLQQFNKPILRVADLGTGSGAIALALAHERPTWEVYATDQSQSALQIAVQNAKRLAINNVQFCLGDWCAALPPSYFDVIVSNPPYLAPNEVTNELAFEPLPALVSGQDGMCAIRQIILQAKSYLSAGSCLFLEHGYTQSIEIRRLFEVEGYIEVRSYRDIVGIERVTVGVMDDKNIVVSSPSF